MCLNDKHMHHRTSGFTLIEIVVAVSILAILAGLALVGLGSWQRAQSTSVVKSDVQQAVAALGSFKNFKGNYPPNLAGTGFAASQDVALKLSTNAPSVGVYEELDDDQNAQLFLNTCNAAIFTTPTNTACSFQGNTGGAKVHVKGTESSNAIWTSPIERVDLELSCGVHQAACEDALTSLLTQFDAQGGVFPIIVPSHNVALPEPTQTPNGPANRYCLEGRSNDYPDIVFYSISDSPLIQAGGCPADPTLHYYQ